MKELRKSINICQEYGENNGLFCLIMLQTVLHWVLFWGHTECF